ncbi:MAG: protein-methionine-sulfoxide reductase catalytic subunit MsrP [Pseudomonadota bacterium]
MKRFDNDIRASEITDEAIYHDRRRLLTAAGLIGAGAVVGGATIAGLTASGRSEARTLAGDIAKSPFSTDEAPNSFEDISTYNNFYEFGTAKHQPAVLAKDFVPLPWTVDVSGEAQVTGTFDFDDLVKEQQLEERIYRLRCVEAWSMVVPWVGIPLASLLSRFKPLSSAKYVEFQTLFDPKRMPGQRRPVLQWPYREGLRMDEAMNPLTLMAVGVYGKPLPNQNGAPMRLVVPWKYGFKSIKSINRIVFRETQPVSSWEQSAPQEYGFYANVNPEVSHPRWSQARERRIGESLFGSRRPTLKYNGYGEHVAQLYDGMDLAKYY